MLSPGHVGRHQLGPLADPGPLWSGGEQVQNLTNVPEGFRLAVRRFKAGPGNGGRPPGDCVNCGKNTLWTGTGPALLLAQVLELRVDLGISDVGVAPEGYPLRQYNGQNITTFKASDVPHVWCRPCTVLVRDVLLAAGIAIGELGTVGGMTTAQTQKWLRQLGTCAHAASTDDVTFEPREGSMLCTLPEKHPGLHTDGSAVWSP